MRLVYLCQMVFNIWLNFCSRYTTETTSLYFNFLCPLYLVNFIFWGVCPLTRIVKFFSIISISTKSVVIDYKNNHILYFGKLLYYSNENLKFNECLNHRKIYSGPGWCGSRGFMLACKLKDHGFNSQSGHKTGLWFQLGACKRQLTYGYFSCFLPFPLSKNIKIKSFKNFLAFLIARAVRIASSSYDPCF